MTAVAFSEFVLREVRRFRLWATRHRSVLFASLLIFAVAFIPRVIGIGLFLTADEKNWLGRSMEFIRAVQEFRFNDTLQTTHPGVTTLWLSGAAVMLATKVFGMPFSSDALQRFAVLPQLTLALVNTLLVVAIYLVARRIIAPRIAFFASLVIALDPFLIGYSKVVHVDALLTGLFTLAVLLLVVSREQRSPTLFLWSAIVSALAILTKVPALVLLPIAAVVLFADSWKGEREVLRERMKLFAEWLLLIGVVVLLLWPALLWVPNPRGNVNIIRRDVTTAFVTPHHMEESYTLNPWQYPATLLARSTPPVLLGVLALLFFLSTKRGRKRITAYLSLRTLALLGVSLGCFFLLMFIGAKKGDRYILPLFPLLDLFGVVGLAALGRAVLKSARHLRLAAAVLIILLAGMVLRLGPYALAYYNPLFPPNLSQELGWGEGLDQVARFLDAQPDTASVASWYPEELRALTKKPVAHINAHEQIPFGYVVLYRNMFGRPADHWANDFIDEYYRKRTPVFVANVNGLPYAWVYRKPVYSTVLGQLTPDRLLVAELVSHAANLSRVDALTVTYGGKATSGSLVLRLRENVNGADLRVVRIPVAEIENNDYTAFSFDPIADSAGKTYHVLLSAEGTVVGDAPSVRAAPKEQGRSYALLIGQLPSPETVADAKRNGLIGLRWYFTSNGREVDNEEVD